MVHQPGTLFDALSDRRRRQLLFDLLAGDPPIHLDSPPDTIGDNDAARLEYHHVHLPKLADYGYIEWEPSEPAVETGPRFDEIRPTLELLAANRDELSPREEWSH